MRTVIQLLGNKATSGDVGIEIECEGDNLPNVDDREWRCEDDGSLRGVWPTTRNEYIFKKPLKLPSVRPTLEHLTEYMEGNEAVLKFSYRTSVHVHVNVQDLEYQQLLAMMYAYYLLEEPFMTYCGKTRKGNNFCLRLADAEGLLETANKMFENGDQGIHHIARDQNRYAAMNFESLAKYGSLEFRGMEGNLDVDRITNWCTALVSLREFARKIDTPKAVYDLYNAEGPVGFMNKVLGKLDVEFFYAKIAKDIITSFSITIDLPFSFERYLSQPRTAEKNSDDWVVGDLITYEQAVDFVGRGGQVRNGPNPGNNYIVEKEATIVPRKPVLRGKALVADQW